MMVLLAGVGSLVAERVAPRLDSAVVLRAGLSWWPRRSRRSVLAPVFPVFVLGLAAYGVGLGLVDAIGNMQAVASSTGSAGSCCRSCHGAWTLGGVVGAVITLTTGSAPWSAIALLALLPLAVAAAPFLPRDHGEAATATETDVPWRAIVLVGLALVVFYTVDTAAATWVLVHPRRRLRRARGAGRAGDAALPAGRAGSVRLVGDGLTERVGAVRLLRVGAAVAFVALAIIVAAPSWPVAVAGFTLLGCGVAVVAPLSFSAAAALAGRDADPATRNARVDAVVARFNQFNYAGALIGAVMTGAVGAGSLRVGFAVPLVLVVALFWLARAFAPAD